MSRIPTLAELNAPNEQSLDRFTMPRLAELNAPEDTATPVTPTLAKLNASDEPGPAAPTLAELNKLSPEEITGRISDLKSTYTIRSRNTPGVGMSDRQARLTFPQMYQTFVPPAEQQRLSLARAEALAKNDLAAITRAETAIYNATRAAVDAIDPIALPESGAAVLQSQWRSVPPTAQASVSQPAPVVGVQAPAELRPLAIPDKDVDVFQNQDGTFTRINQRTRESRPATAEEYQAHQDAWSRYRGTAKTADEFNQQLAKATRPAGVSHIQTESGAQYSVEPATGDVTPVVERGAVGGVAAGLVRGAGAAVESVGNVIDAATSQEGWGGQRVSPMAVISDPMRQAGKAIQGSAPASTTVEQGGVFQPSNWRWYTERGSEAVPVLLGQLGALVASRGKSAESQFAAFAAPAVAQVFGSSYQAAVDRGMSPDTARGEALVNAAISAAMQKVNISPLLTNSTAKQYFQNAVMNRIMQVGTKALAEGGSNALVSMAQAAAEDTTRYLAEQDPEAFKDWQQRYFAAGTQGGVAGTVMGGVSAAMDRQPQASGNTPKAEPLSIKSGQAPGDVARSEKSVSPDSQRIEKPIAESAGQSRPMSTERAGAQAGDEASRQMAAAESASATPTALRGNTGSQQDSPTGNQSIQVNHPGTPLREITPERKELVLKGLTRAGGVDRAKAESVYESILRPSVESLAKMEGVSPADMMDRIDFQPPKTGEKERLSRQRGSDVLGSTVLVRIGDTGRAVIKYMKGSDPATAIHEPLHAIRLLMGEVAKRSAAAKRILQGFERDIGVKDGVWTTTHEEFFVDRFMNYLKTGEAPSPRTKTFFSHVKDMLNNLVRSVGLSEASPAFRQFAEALLRYGESADTAAPAVRPPLMARPKAEKIMLDTSGQPSAASSADAPEAAKQPGAGGRSHFQQTHIAFDPPESQWSLSGLMHKAYAQFVNQAHPLISLIADTGPAKKADAINQIARIRGHQGITEELLRGKGFRDITSSDHPERLLPGSKSLEQILSPLRESRELYEDYETYRIAQRHVALGLNRQDVLSDPFAAGAELDRLRIKYTPEQMKILESVSADHRQYDRHLLDALHKAGRISDELYNKIVNAPEADSYASFAREIDQLPDDTAKAGTGSIGPKRIKGSELRVQPTVESTITATERVVRFVEQQKINKLLTGLRDQPGMDQYIKEAKAPSASTISTWAGGKEQHWEIPRDIKNALGYTTPQEMNLAMKALSIPAKMLRAGATLSLDFIARNPVRDQFSAFINAEHGFVPIYDTVRGLFEYLGRSDLYHEWQAAGGAQAFFTSLDRDATHMTAKSLLGQGPKWYTRWARNPLDALRGLSEFTEVGTRLGVYRRARESGAGAVEAARNSREATIDFQRAGSVGRSINQITAFWNANVQGVDILARRLADPKTRNITLMRIGLGIVAPTIGVWLWNNRDEESRQRYLNIPRTTRNLFWTIDMGPDRPALRIPKPFEVGIVFGSLPERVMDWTAAKDSHALDHFAETAGGALVPGVIPTAALPALEWVTNYSFFRGRPLENDSLQKLPAGMRATPYTSEIAARAGKLTDLSPVKIDNWVKGWTGTLGTQALSIADKGAQVAGLRRDTGESVAKNWYEYTPGVRGFVVQGEKSSRVDDFYEDLRASSEKLAAWKLLAKTNAAKAEDYLNKNRADIMAAIAGQQVQDQVKELRERMRETQDSTSLSGEQKKSALNALNREMTDAAAAYLDQHQNGQYAPEMGLKLNLMTLEAKYGLNRPGVKLRDVVRQVPPADRARLMKLRAIEQKIQTIRKYQRDGKTKPESADKYIRGLLKKADAA